LRLVREREVVGKEQRRTEMIRTLSCAICTWLLLVASTQDARAALILTMVESGGDVLVTGNGTVDLTGLTLQGSGGAIAVMVPTAGELTIGGAGSIDVYTGLSSPGSFGPGGFVLPSVSAGDIMGILNGPTLLVPGSYTSGTALAGSSTFAGHSFGSLGVNPGTYVWTWGAGASADSLTLQVGPAVVPEPATTILGALGLAAMAVRRRLSGNRAN
jgi:hypothetical protein